MLSSALLRSQLEHEKYQMSLSDWEQFIIWSYTIGSGTVNNYLIGLDINDNLSVWANRIVTTFNEVSRTSKLVAPGSFDRYLSGKSKNYINLLILYINELQNIILTAPPLIDDIIVYKASTPYPELKIGNVYQKPFNSTSYKVDMNFSMFLPKDGMCCMHKIILTKGSKVLILSPHLSAYPYECEVILPRSITFNIHFMSSMKLNVPENTKQMTWKNIQRKPITIGPLYEYNHKIDCKTVSRDVKLYISTVRS